MRSEDIPISTVRIIQISDIPAPKISWVFYVFYWFGDCPWKSGLLDTLVYIQMGKERFLAAEHKKHTSENNNCSNLSFFVHVDLVNGSDVVNEKSCVELASQIK